MAMWDVEVSTSTDKRDLQQCLLVLEMDAWTQHVGKENKTATVGRKTMVRPRIALEQWTLRSVRESAGKDEQPELKLTGLEL